MKFMRRLSNAIDKTFRIWRVNWNDYKCIKKNNYSDILSQTKNIKI